MDDNNHIITNQIKDLNNINNKKENNIYFNHKKNIKERYKEIYDILYDRKNNKKEEIRKQKLNKPEPKSKSYRNNFLKTDANNYHGLTKKQTKLKMYDYKISLLYDKIYSLQKQLLKKPKYSYPKIETNDYIINDYQENNINNIIKFGNNNDNNFKTPFQKYKYDIYPKKKEKEQPLKLFKYNSNTYNTISTNESNNKIYKNYRNQRNYNTINNIDKWINQEKQNQKINYYNDKKNEINDLVSFTKNYENKPLSFRNNDYKYYSDNYFAKELKRFTSLLNRTNDNKKISKSTFIENYYSKK